MGWNHAVAIVGSAGILAAVFGVLFLGFSLMRIASRPTPKPGRLEDSADVVFGSQQRPTLVDRRRPQEELSSDFESEERVDGKGKPYHYIHFI